MISNGLLTGLGVAALLFAAAFAGIALRPRLPVQHRSRESEQAVNLATNMIATLSAVVLGLLTASVKGQFDGVEQQVQNFAASAVELDRNLRAFGAEAAPSHAAIVNYLQTALARTWAPTPELDSPDLAADMQALQTGVLQLRARTELQQRLLPAIDSQIVSLAAQRWNLIAHATPTLSPALEGLLVFWLALVFLGLGLNAPRNALTLATLALCATALGGLMFLTVEMDGAFDGLIRVSRAPIEGALAQIVP